MEILGRIRRMHLRDGLGFSEIARRTGLSINTVKRWLKDAAPGKVAAPKYQRPEVPGKLAPYMAQIRRWLVADAGRIKPDRRTGRHIFETIKQQGFVRGYSRLTDTIGQWRERQASATGSKPAFVPLAFASGEAVVV